MAKYGSPRTAVPTEYTANLRKRILELRREGVSFPKIGVILGAELRNGDSFTHRYIYKQYKKALDLIVYEDAEQVKKMELARLDSMLEKLYRMLDKKYYHIARGMVVRDTVDNETGGLTMNEQGEILTERIEDSGPHLQIMDRILKVMERRAKLLGLDAPAKTALTNPDGTAEASGVMFYLPSNGRDEPQEAD